MAAGKPRKFATNKELEDAIQHYFDSITITRPATKQEIEGYEDNEKKKPIYKDVPLLNNAGEQIYYTEYIEHPSILGMCRHIGLTREGLREYGNRIEYADTVKRAKDRIEEYLETKLYSKDVVGTIFNLKNNFGWVDKTETSINMEVTAIPAEERRARIEALKAKLLEDTVDTDL